MHGLGGTRHPLGLPPHSSSETTRMALWFGPEGSKSPSLSPSCPAHSGSVTGLTTCPPAASVLLGPLPPTAGVTPVSSALDRPAARLSCGGGEALRRDPGSQTEPQPCDWQLLHSASPPVAPGDGEALSPPDRLTCVLTSPASHAAQLPSCRLWLGSDITPAFLL